MAPFSFRFGLFTLPSPSVPRTKTDHIPPDSYPPGLGQLCRDGRLAPTRKRKVVNGTPYSVPTIGTLQTRRPAHPRDKVRVPCTLTQGSLGTQGTRTVPPPLPWYLAPVLTVLCEKGRRAN